MVISSVVFASYIIIFYPLLKSNSTLAIIFLCRESPFCWFPALEKRALERLIIFLAPRSWNNKYVVKCVLLNTWDLFKYAYRRINKYTRLNLMDEDRFKSDDSAVTVCRGRCIRVSDINTHLVLNRLLKADKNMPRVIKLRNRLRSAKISID